MLGCWLIPVSDLAWPQVTTLGAPRSLAQFFLAVDADPARRARMMAAGKDVESRLCGACHGVDGNSVNPEVPNLAGQNAVYIVVQIRKLLRGERKHETMQIIAKMLPDDDIVNVAYYLSKQRVTSPPKESAPSAQVGETIFQTQFCIYCHGAEARGNEQIPRLAGQQRDYLLRSLRQYRDRSGERNDAMMSLVLNALTDDDIVGLADYLNGLGMPGGGEPQ